jgi:hypothetical protein
MNRNNDLELVGHHLLVYLNDDMYDLFISLSLINLVLILMSILVLILMSILVLNLVLVTVLIFVLITVLILVLIAFEELDHITLRRETHSHPKLNNLFPEDIDMLSICHCSPAHSLLCEHCAMRLFAVLMFLSTALLTLSTVAPAFRPPLRRTRTRMRLKVGFLGPSWRAGHLVLACMPFIVVAACCCAFVRAMQSVCGSSV